MNLVVALAAIGCNKIALPAGEPVPRPPTAASSQSDPGQELNEQIEDYNATRTPGRGMSPISQRVWRVAYDGQQDVVHCYDQEGDSFLTLERQPDGRFKGIIQVEYHELFDPEEGHSWGHVLVELYLDGDEFIR